MMKESLYSMVFLVYILRYLRLIKWIFETNQFVKIGKPFSFEYYVNIDDSVGSRTMGPRDLTHVFVSLRVSCQLSVPQTV